MIGSAQIAQRDDIADRFARGPEATTFEAWRYPMIIVFATNLYCSPMYTEKADDAVLDTPDLVSTIEVMDAKQADVLGRLPTKEESVVHSWAVFRSVVPH